MEPYIGVTGFTKRKEVELALMSLPEDGSRKLMVGVLVSWKSLRGIPLSNQWEARYPIPDQLQELMVNDPRVMNIIHYSCNGKTSSIVSDLLSIVDLVGHLNFEGFQLNIPWPPASILDQYQREAQRGDYIILQLGSEALRTIGGPQEAAERLTEVDYAGLLNGILYDPSGGQGLPFNTEEARTFLRAMEDLSTGRFSLGVAGGLGPETLHLVAPLLEEFPNLSFDAEGLLRNDRNELDLDRVRQYIENALELTSSAL